MIMKRLFAMFSLLFFVLVVQAQSITHKAFDTNGPVGECLFPEDAEGNIVYSDIIQCGLSADTIKGLFREWLYTLKQEQRADIDEELDGVTKMVCEIELPIGKEFYKMSVPYGEIATFERHTSQVTFICTIEIRNGRYRYTLTDFCTNRRMIRGEAKSEGPSNLIHWQRLNSLKKEREETKRKSEIEEYNNQIAFEEVSYQAEYDAIQMVIKGIRELPKLLDVDF